MRTLLAVLLGVLPFACASAEGQAGPGPSPSPTPGPSPAPRGGAEGPVIVELFTSQGCSSCPPAERLLRELHRDRPDVIALAFHVDYWDDLGWADPFASPAWSERQRRYSRALGDDRVYTPELVVAGGAGAVGSQRGEVGAAIRAAPPQHAISARATWSRDALTVTATAPADADVLVAVWENHTSTAVARGENRGETQVSDHVVRRLERVATAGHTGTATIALDPRWRDVGAVAFAQRADMRITGAAVLAK